MSGDSIDAMIENFVGSVRQNNEEIADNSELSTFTLKEEKKTNEGAAQYLLREYPKGWKHHFPKKRAEPKWTKWGDIVRDGYFGWNRLGKKRFEVIIGIAGGEIIDEKLVIEAPEELSEEVEETKKNPISWADEEPSEDGTTDWEYDPDEEPSEQGWQGFSKEELEIIDIINAAYLRGHTPQISDRPSFYTVHQRALCNNEPMPVAARKKEGGAGYCSNADGRYTGGLMNCAVTSAKWGMGIMVPEEKERVQKACIKACPNCPNKRWAHKEKNDG